MRVIAGTLKGRQFASPHGNRTHPMSEKVRGGLFNALGDISGLEVLDAFAGSGALSFEAISRGAATVTAVDIDKNAHTALLENVAALQLEEQVQVVRANVVGWLFRNSELRYDLIFADPPYDAIRDRTLDKLATRAREGGLIVYSLPPNDRFKLPADTYEKVALKSYGDATLVFYRRIK